MIRGVIEHGDQRFYSYSSQWELGWRPHLFLISYKNKKEEIKKTKRKKGAYNGKVKWRKDQRNAERIITIKGTTQVQLRAKRVFEESEEKQLRK